MQEEIKDVEKYLLAVAQICHRCKFTDVCSFLELKRQVYVLFYFSLTQIVDPLIRFSDDGISF